MPSSPIIVLTDAAGGETTPAEVSAILELWSVQRPPIKVLNLDEAVATPAKLDGAAAFWLWLEAGESNALFELVGLLEERHVPTMLTRAGETEPLASVVHEGILVCPPGTEPAVACAMLQALASQSVALRALRTELALLHAQQGGLCDQMGKIDEELRLAAQLQREFLPTKLPRIGRVGFDVLWRPAGYVSGDIYDVIRLDDRHVGFFIADAVGHGVPAALMTVYIKRSLHTRAADETSPTGFRLVEPREALARLNRDLIEHQAGKVRFATASYGLLDLETLSLKLARAGHPFPMLLRAAGETELLQIDGGLLGVFPEEQYHQKTIQLQAGDRLLMYSDGFELAFPDAPKDDRGRRRIANEHYTAEFERLRDGVVEERLAELAAKLDVQAGSLNQRDDLTVLCVSIDAEDAASESLSARAA